MPPILDLITSVEQKLKTLKNLEDAKRKAERDRRRTHDLTDLNTICSDIIDSAKALQSQSVPLKIPPGRDLTSFLSRHGKLVGEAACQQIRSEDFPTELRKLESSLESAADVLNTAWQKFAVPPLDGDKVARIGNIFGDAKTRSGFSQIAADCRQISAAALKVPKQPKDVRKTKDLKSQVESKIEDMKSKGIDKEVLAFLLENVTPGNKTSLKAAFAKPSVKKWLLSEDHAEHFQLIVST